MATVTEKLAALNEADLSGLRARLDALRAQAKKALEDLGENPGRNASESDVSAAAAAIGLSADDLLAALEWSRQLT